MNKKRLLDLIDTVKKVPAKLFDMGVFHEKQSCGTVGCAAGHYAARFRSRGLTLKQLQSWDGDSFLQQHFGLSAQQTLDTFFGCGLTGAAGKKHVIGKIKEVIAANEASPVPH